MDITPLTTEEVGRMILTAKANSGLSLYSKARANVGVKLYVRNSEDEDWRLRNVNGIGACDGIFQVGDWEDYKFAGIDSESNPE